MASKNQKIYLDVCTLCRPFDDQKMMRIRLETDAFYLIMHAVQNGRYQLTMSPVHIEEIEANSNFRERLQVHFLLERFGSRAECDPERARSRARALHELGFGVADAAHVAFAEATSDAFITCDDKLLKRCRKTDLDLGTMNPVEFAMKEDLK